MEDCFNPRPRATRERMPKRTMAGSCRSNFTRSGGPAATRSNCKGPVAIVTARLPRLAATTREHVSTDPAQSRFAAHLASNAPAQKARPTDATHHSVQLVTMEPGVKLEVTDCGGTGENTCAAGVPQLWWCAYTMPATLFENRTRPRYVGL